MEVLIIFVFFFVVFYLRNSDKTKNGYTQDNFDTQAFAIASLCSVIIMADCRFSKKELEIVKKYLAKNFSQEQGQKVLLFLRDTSKKSVSVKVACLYANRSLSYHNKISITSLLFRLASANGGIGKTQSELLSQIMQHINLRFTDRDLFWQTFADNVNDNEFKEDQYNHDNKYRNSQSSSYRSNSSRYTAAELNAYKVLGLEPGASKDDVKKAYRKLIVENHPDKFAGASEHRRRMATEKTAELNKAYDILEKI
ncbi:MAG: DnaJ domain-containing protein [Paludibacteraceae bacterium]|nr:DnaJ domain-containing protein [Paludibacteraceae bacterium]MEE1541653.1 DnaJ domain-containing protein [Paludibacteraceae bacterium]